MLFIEEKHNLLTLLRGAFKDFTEWIPFEINSVKTTFLFLRYRFPTFFFLFFRKITLGVYLAKKGLDVSKGWKDERNG